MKTPILETERLILRPMEISDAENIFNNWTSDPEISKYMRWNTHQSIDETIGFITHVQSNFESEQNYDWGLVLKESGQLIGSGGIYYCDEEQLFEVGYCIMKEHWNKGFTTEAAKEFVRFAFCELKQERLYARHAKDNPASGKVLEKAGFVYHSDSEYPSLDGKRIFKSRKYYLERF